MNGFIRHTKGLAQRLERLLSEMECDRRVALLHYSPIAETLSGERLEIYPFLGSYLLEHAIEHVGADLVLHGHAHAGSPRGVTSSGIPVWNVAQTLLEDSVAIVTLEPVWVP